MTMVNQVSMWFLEDDISDVNIVPTDKYNEKVLYLIGQLPDINNISNLIANIKATIEEGTLLQFH